MASSINQQTTSAGEDVGTAEPFCTIVWNAVGAASVESSMEITQKIKNGSVLWPSDPTSGNLSKGTPNTNAKEHKHPYVNCCNIYIAKIWKQPKCPSVDKWIKQLWDIYTMEYYLAVKKKKILPFETVLMDLENIMLREISQSEKDKYTILLICGI